MADKPISQLNAAERVKPADLFVLEQDGTAKKLTGQTLENWLVSFADGHGGIQTIAKASTSGLVDTYRITYADQTTSTFTVTNGAKGDKGNQTYVWFKWSNVATPRDVDMSDTPAPYIGVYTGTSTTAPTTAASYRWYQYKGTKGDKGDAASISSSSILYQAHTNGTVAPTGSWSDRVPAVPPGQYLWTRVDLNWNTGDHTYFYSVSRNGVDGSGAVASVNTVPPDGDGNITLTASDVSANDNRSIQAHLSTIESDSYVAQHIGTGTITASNLAANSVSMTYTATIPASAWTGSAAPYQANVSVTGITSADTPVVDMVASSVFATAQAQSEAYSYIYRITTGGNMISCYASEKPTVDIPVQLKVVRK